ncbi:alkaline phosphatase [Clostridium sp.]|uniref:alkaline phosphatase n=1 Tax=Clostridium sp. TaxID=1506 RepID=UPI003F2D29E1
MVLKKIINKIIAATGVAVMIGAISFNAVAPVEVNASDDKIKNVIYLIGDGMSDTTVTLARYFEDVKDGKIGNYKMAMDEIRVGFAKTNSLSSPITDSAAGGTALASGVKTINGRVGIDGEGKPVANLLEAAREEGKSTGLISSSHPTDATPAAFSSHYLDRNKEFVIGKQQVYSNLDVYFGGDGTPEVTEEMVKEVGYDVVRNREGLNSIEDNKVWGIFTKELDINREEFAPEQPSLAEQTKKAIEILEKDEDGFALTIEGSKIDWEAHSQQAIGMATETLAFDEAVRVALDYAKDRNDTIVIVTSDHGNSGISIGNESTTVGYDNLTFEDSLMNLNGIKVNEGKFKSLIKGKSDAEIRTLAKEYMNFDNLTDVELEALKNQDINSVISGRVKLGYTTKKHTGGDVYLGAYVPAGNKKLSGTIHLSEVARFIEGSLSLDLDGTTYKLYDENIKASLEALGAEVTIIENEGIDIVAEAKKDDVTMKIYGNTDIVEIVDGEASETYRIDGVNVISEDTIYGNNEIVEKFKAVVGESEGENPDEEGNGGNPGEEGGNNGNQGGDNGNNGGNTGNGGNQGGNGSSNGGTNKPTKPGTSLPNTGAVVGSLGLLSAAAVSIAVGAKLAKKNKKSQ